MESRDFGAVLKEVQTLFSVGTVAALSDDYLLDSFLGRREDAAEVAFEALVRRHGPMVLRVCRDELRDVHAAEDAFQATFLILARRAGSIRKRGSIASWLFGVARRVAKRANVERARQTAYERRSAVMDASHQSESDHYQADLVPEIQEEVDKLPEKYRSPIVLCYLEGLTHEEAASQLRLPVGTLKVRLSRARERLRGRLVRRGLAPIIMAATVSGKASGAVPTPLLNMTVKAATPFALGRSAGVSASVASLVDGVLRAMYLTKLKTAAALLATSLAAIFSSLLIVSYSPRPARSDQPLNDLQAPPLKADAAPEIAVETLKRTAFMRTSTQPGTVQAAESAEVYPRASGYIKRVTVEIGDAVKRGQLLAEIFEPELDLELRKGLALVEQAKTRVLKARSLIRVAQSAMRVQQARATESEAGLGQTEPIIFLRQKEYDRIKELSTIRSGTEGASVPVLSIVGARKMKVVVNVPDRDAPFLDNGDPVTVEMDAVEGRKFVGVIARTAFAEDPVTRSLRAEIDLDNNDGRLRPGQAGRVTISLRARDILAIPVTALFDAPVGRDGACFRVLDGRAVRTLVTRGEVQGDRVEVLKGLKEGDTVIVQPRAAGISDGQLIKSEKRTQGSNN
jgi:RNA polymerase sigma factor (sigma-70 family)